MRRIVLFAWVIIMNSPNVFALNLDGYSYKIQSKYSGNCIENEGANQEDGIKIVQNLCRDGNEQVFTFSKVSGNDYSIALSTGKFLSMAVKSRSNGINLIQSSNLEIFTLEEVGEYYKIKSKNTGKYLTIEQASSDIVQVSKHNDDDQLWIIGNIALEPISEEYNYFQRNGMPLDIGGSHGWGAYVQQNDGRNQGMLEYVQRGGGGSIIIDLGKEIFITRLQLMDYEKFNNMSLTNWTTKYKLRFSIDNFHWEESIVDYDISQVTKDVLLNKGVRYIEAISLKIGAIHTVGTFRLFAKD